MSDKKDFFEWQEREKEKLKSRDDEHPQGLSSNIQKEEGVEFEIEQDGNQEGSKGLEISDEEVEIEDENGEGVQGDEEYNQGSVNIIEEENEKLERIKEDDEEYNQLPEGVFQEKNEEQEQINKDGDEEEDEDEEKIIDIDNEEREYSDDVEMGQVSSDLFGREEKDVNEDDGDDNSDDDDEDEDGGKKVSFEELRNGRKTPRLKKNFVISILFIGIIGFLLFVSVLTTRKHKEQEEYSQSREEVRKGDNLLDISKRNDNDLSERKMREKTDGDSDFGNVPGYGESRPWERKPNNQGGNNSGRDNTAQQYQSPAVVDPQAEQEKRDREKQAELSSLRKDGGYGINNQRNQNSVNNENQSQYNSTQYPQSGGMSNNDRFSAYTEMIKASQGGGGNSGEDKNRVFDNGSYNMNNKDVGGYEYLDNNVIFPGTIIHAVLVSRIDTDYPGPIHARVTENIYDSKTGENLLIPQGTILQGNYSSASIGVAKVQIAWESMVVNYDGIAYQVSLGGMAGVDKRGRAGIAGTIDDHYFEWLKAAGIISLFTMFNSEIAYQTKGNKNKQQQELIDINQGIVNQIGDRLMNRALSIQPTVKVANGKAVSVTVNKPLALRPFKAFEVEQRYVRRSNWR